MVSLHYHGSNRFLFVNVVKMYQFKAKDSEIKPYSMCLGNISKTFTINNMNKTGLSLLAPVSQNGQTHSSNSLAIFRRIV